MTEKDERFPLLEGIQYVEFDIVQYDGLYEMAIVYRSIIGQEVRN